MSTAPEIRRGIKDTLGSAAPHPEHLYRAKSCAPAIPSLDAFTQDSVAFFHDHGYLAVSELFDRSMVDQALEGMNALVRGDVPEYRGLHYERAFTDEQIKGMNDGERLDAVRKFWDFVDVEPRMAAMARDPRILDTVSRLMGGAEPYLFQNGGLIKPPSVGREKPWHQDLAYFNLPPETPVVALWIALDEASVENGCMHVLDGAHRTPIVHFQRRDWQICDTFFEDGRSAGREVLAAPLKAGGGLFFSGLLPHGTPTNNSAKRRRALQFWWRPADTKETPVEDRLAVWGSEGKDVEC